jgi:quinol---cytochrome c reductase iron-sulfur subunit, bacillus type
MRDGMSDTDDGTESPSRRRFFTIVGTGAGALAAGGIGAALGGLALAPLARRAAAEGARVDIGALDSFDAVRDGTGGPREVIFTRMLEDGYMSRRAKQRAYVVADRSSPSGIAVLDTTCSHLGCGVSFNADKNAFLCPCHGGVYDTEGRVLAGPPPRPLTRLPFVVDGGRVALDVAKLAG